MFDKNTLRVNHRDLFVAAIGRYQQDLSSPVPAPDLSVCTLRLSRSAVSVFVRKRPIFENEATRGDYDVVTILPGLPLPTQVVLHNCLFQADLKTPFLSNLLFEFDHVLGEDAQDLHVYRVAAADLVLSARDGGAGTILMFGQTGSGKTHTMSTIEEMAARDLFNGNTTGASDPPGIAIEFVELRANRCFDLLGGAPKDRRPELKLQENAKGTFAAEGAVQLHPKTAAELHAAMRLGHSRRATLMGPRQTRSRSTKSPGARFRRRRWAQRNLAAAPAAISGTG